MENRPEHRGVRGARLHSIAGLLAALALAAAFGLRDPRTASGTGAPTQLPAPIDPQVVQDQDDMTWADYRPIPGENWADPARVPTRRQFRVALVAIDFDDQPFVITQPRHSDLFGNPQIDPVPRERVPQFYADFFNTPSAVNHGQTINGYWMEQSRGRIGIGKIDAYGPYRMPKKLFQYGLDEWGQQGGLPSGYEPGGRMEPDADSLWAADAGADIRSGYDIILRIYAGYDETGVWQEFGEMKFASRDDIPPEWGNPDTSKPRWVVTRYVPWTSWKAGQMQWGLSSVRQGENSGTITHEIAHFAFGVGDNNNNPYIQPFRRVGSGPWDIMDRGSFNGPGGPHRRWVVPPTEGAAMPAGLTLRSRILHSFLSDGTLLELNRDGLARSGLAVGRVVARAVEPGPGQLAGISIRLDGAEPTDRTPPDDMNANPLSAGRPEYDFYTVEVVQRIGYDSFTPDNGVLIAKNKDGRPNDGTLTGRGGGRGAPPAGRGAGAAAGRGRGAAGDSAQAGGRGRGGRGGGGGSCGASYNCFAWVIDAHPEDTGKVDFTKPNGEVVMRTIADYRQLNDALFHAGLNSGSSYEWQDPHNRLHFYVVDVHREDGILSYTIGVKSLDGAGPQARGVSIAPAAAQRLADATGTCTFDVANTGAAVAADASLHPRDATAFLNHDIYRLSASAAGRGWSARLANALAAVRFGEAQQVAVHVERAPDAAAEGTVTLQAVSESDPSRTASASCSVST